MWINLALIGLILLVLCYADRYAAVYLSAAVLADRMLWFPWDLVGGLLLLQLAFAVARAAQPRNGADGALMPEGERLFAINKDRIAPAANPAPDRRVP